MAGTLTRTAKAELAVNGLMLTTVAPATPFLVCRAAELFEAMLAQIEPASLTTGLTLVVSNLEMKMALRPWDTMGAAVVGLATALIANPIAAVQAHPHLSSAAMFLASHAERLQQYGATFWDEDRQLREVDSEFVRDLYDAAGLGGLELTHVPSRAALRGETVLHTPVLRVGKSRSRHRLSAQIIANGRTLDARVAASAEDDVWAAARLDHPVELRVRCEWVDSGGRLRIVRPEILTVSLAFRPATGQQMLAEFAEHGSDAFSPDDFARILADIGDAQDD